PAFWGLINPEWSLCNKGRRQSPVNLEPNKLLFDPNLRQLHIDKHRFSAKPASLALKSTFAIRFVSGPAFWGLINPEWSLCNKGRRQSPVNLEPSKLLFDPNLRQLHIDKHRVSGTMMNTGHSVIFTVYNDTHSHINVTGGPLSYRYQFQEIHIHYGLHDQFGSEHSINGYAFPAEVSIWVCFQIFM
ncbi:hypothetical protein HUJ04_013595, partial [Dendroctonus ponderosae]